MSDMFFTENLERFYTSTRKWQGIPGLERSAGGRLFATFYSGENGEENGNYVPLMKSDDNGASWSEPIAVAYNGMKSRAYDECLWIDPLGRLWFFWSIMPEQEVWCAICDDPDADILKWGEPRKVFREIMINKPTVLANGDWLFPVAVWLSHLKVYYHKNSGTPFDPDSVTDCGSYVWRSRDEGKSFERLGCADVPDRCFDEHMVVELRDGRLLMLVRTFYGIGKSYSSDGGVTWSTAEDSGLGGPNSRFFIRRLASGRLLLVNHRNFTGRNNLTAMLSEDDGESWKGFLMLDERANVSYPDGVQDESGRIYIVYDRDRNGAGDILMADITEEDILAGKLTDPKSRLRITVCTLAK